MKTIVTRIGIDTVQKVDRLAAKTGLTRAAVIALLVDAAPSEIAIVLRDPEDKPSHEIAHQTGRVLDATRLSPRTRPGGWKIVKRSGR